MWLTDLLEYEGSCLPPQPPGSDSPSLKETCALHCTQWVKRASESRIFQANLPLCDMSEREKETSPTQQMCNWAPTMEKHSRRCLRKCSHSRLLRFGKMDLLRWTCSDGPAQMYLSRWTCSDGPVQMDLLRWICSDGPCQMDLFRWI